MYKIIATILTIFTFTFITYAQDGNIDYTFNPINADFGNGNGANGIIRTTSIQSDGKIIIGGEFTFYNGTAKNNIARLNSNGTLDGTFNLDAGANGTIQTTSIQSDGKIIIGGSFTSYNGTAINRIARLNTDGTLDTSFNPGIGANDNIWTTSIQSDGKIIIGGDFTSYNGTTRNRIARLNPNGTLDAVFNPGTGVTSVVRTNLIQSDGKIIIGGNFTSFNGTSRNKIARLNANGTLDNSFNPGTGVSGDGSYINTTTMQTDGKIIIAGPFSWYNGTYRSNIARLNTDGTLDSTFSPGQGAPLATTVYTTALQSDGKIIIGGDFYSFNGSSRNKIARLNTNGTLDSTFNYGTGVYNTISTTCIYTTSIQSDGKIIIGGELNSYNGTAINKVARLNVNGTFDLSFNQGTGANNDVFATSIQSDGKIIIGGNFTFYNGTAINRIARVNTNGTLDNTFNPGLGANGIIRTISLQGDGKIIIGGEFTSYNTTSRIRIARLNVDGSLDSSFNPELGANDHILTTSIQSDGKIIIGGQFTSYNGTSRNYIARLNTDGTLDSFNQGTGANYYVYTTSIQNDNKIIIGGAFSSFDGNNRRMIARLNINGTNDVTFNPGTGANDNIYTTSIQSNGKIIIGGIFTSFNGTTRYRIARLNIDGTIDNTFNPGTGAYYNDNIIRTTSIQSNGKIIIGGEFTFFNNTARNNIARLHSNGVLDSAFNPGTGANNPIYSTSIQSDGKIIIGGVFSHYNDNIRNRIARINSGSLLGTTFFEKNGFVIYPNPSKGVFKINTNDLSVAKNITIYSILGQFVLSRDITANENIIDISNQPKGVYLYNILSENNEVTSGKLILD
jgi:uncharacterized delta-60 repeat protein